MLPEVINILDDKDYHSSSDEDFDLNRVDSSEDGLSSSNETSSGEGTTTSRHKPTNKRKRTKSLDPEQEIRFIKTRSQRVIEERAKCGGVAEGDMTTNVEKIWEQMRAAPVGKKSAQNVYHDHDISPAEDNRNIQSDFIKGGSDMLTSETGEAMVSIKSSYEFAGRTIAEEKLVPASSMTARVHLSSTMSDLPQSSERNQTKHRPPPKKRISAFDTAAASRARPVGPAKLNTLEKSRLDWAGFVDKEGIGDDLEKFNKGDKGYLDRQAFLWRVDENRENQWRKAKKS